MACYQAFRPTAKSNKEAAQVMKRSQVQVQSDPEDKYRIEHPKIGIYSL